MKLEPDAPPPSAEEAHGYIQTALLSAAKRQVASKMQPRWESEPDLNLMSVARAYLGERQQPPANDDSVGRYLVRFRDVAWDLCRSGVIRPGWHHFRQPPNFYPEYCFSLTESGRERMLAANAEGRIFTVGAGLVAELERLGSRFGEAFKERVHEAVAAFLGGAPLACCVMCGAASEAVFLTLATEIVGDEKRVLATYQRRDGRKELLRQVVGNLAGEQRDKLGSYVDLIAYWRDLGAHGTPARVNDATARDKLELLRAMATFVGRSWDELIARGQKGRADRK